MASEAQSQARSFEYTPAWVVATVCFVIVLISLFAERGLHKLGKWLKHKQQHQLFEALEKLKEELMLLGFISLLLNLFQGLISRICIPEHVASVMLPCRLRAGTGPHMRLLAEHSQQCPQGQIPFLSIEALHDLHIFIFVLAVVYVIFCASTVVLGGIRIRQWSHWEKSIITPGSVPIRVSRNHDQLREFKERTGNYWRKFRVISWIVAFFKQFYGSITKSDYIALRSGFIRKHIPGVPTYNFHEYMLRTLEHDFKKIVGVSWYLWLFFVIFLLLNVNGWHAYFWLSFLPLVLLLIVGAKLEHIIIELAKEAASREQGGDAEGAPVRPSDELFWFNQPILVLYLIHFILFQNSFEIAFFLWILGTYSFNSCIMEGIEFIIPRIVIGVIVQVLCSYSTLPLYALVSQMGSMFRETLFDEFARSAVKAWAKSSGGSSGEGGSLNKNITEICSPHQICLSQPQPEHDTSCPNISKLHIYEH